MKNSRYAPSRQFDRSVSARDDILARVRAGLARGGRNPAQATPAGAGIAERLARPPVAPGITLPADLTGRFIDCALASSSTVARVAARSEVPGAVAAYLNDLALPLSAALWPELADLDWAAAGIAVAARVAHGDDLVGITGCFCALAETGTLMMASGPHTAATTSLLPETHIAVVPAARIVTGMEAGFALLRQELGALPRAVNFISGPSRTGDIEQTIVLGAHGPYRVHLVIVG